MTKIFRQRDSWVMWITGLFVVFAGIIFGFVILKHRSISDDTQTIPSFSEREILSPTGTVKFTVVRIIDGDSLTVVGADGLEISVRLRGIDAPELGQTYGIEAKQALQTALEAGVIALSKPEKGKYGRYIADLHIGDTWVNKEMVIGGHAWCDQVNSFNRTLYAAEQDAKSREVGLWATPTPNPPWIWRAERR